MEPSVPEAPAAAETPGTDPTPPGRWKLIALIEYDGREPPADLSEQAARGTWAAISSLWHPALLAAAAELPRVESVDFPSAPEPDQIRVVAAGTLDRLPSGYQTQAADAGSVLLEGDSDRSSLIRRVLNCVPGGSDTRTELDSAALDFLALGTARWWLRDLTIAMGHVDCLDVESLTRETLGGARAWCAGDQTGALSRLRAAFELLTQARERFYPVDSYFVDLCLLDPSAPAGVLADALAARVPFSIIAPARAIEALAQRDPDRLSALREAINEGWADVVGGTYGEPDEPFRPLESILWQFRRGGETYRRLLDDRNVETLARRRFGLYPQLPQVAKRFGFRFALHYGFDAGRFPVPLQTKKLWEAPDGSYLESVIRLPVPADRAVAAMNLPWLIARSMKDDHVATVPMVHWPAPLEGWYVDLRRVAAYSPVLSRWVTLSDYFHVTDRPFEMFRPSLDEYVTPYLEQAIAREDPAPISRRVEFTRLRARFDGISCLEVLRHSLSGSTADAATPDESAEPASGESSANSAEADTSALSAVEDALESGRFDEARAGMDRWFAEGRDALAGLIVGHAADAQRGYLVVNPLGIARRCPVLLPDAAADLRPDGPLRVAQFTDEGVWAVVELPAFGYVWVPSETPVDLPPAAIGILSARERTLKNESVEVEIDAATGGLRSIRAAGEPTARLGQQLAVAGLAGKDGGTSSSRMVCERFDVDYGGPALVQAVSEGTIRDPSNDRALARFIQRYRLWSGRPILEIDITLSDLDQQWVDRLRDGDAWSRFLSCRWAWPDANAELTRTSLFSATPTTVERPETPDVIEVTSRRQRSALIFGGLAHHRRHGNRMLDTIFIAGRESCRAFRVAVVLDLEFPFHAAQDFVTPPIVIPTNSGPPRTGPTGWFFHVDNKAVAVTRVELARGLGTGSKHSIAFHMVETAGRAARVRLRLMHNPVSARRTDFQGDQLADLMIEGDAVCIDLTPHEIARVEVALG
jgi:alpha-mannosidase